MVNDLTAQRVGDHILLRWTTPSRTTDDMEIKGGMTAEVCRESDAGSLSPAARLAACRAVRRLSVVPGQSEVVDTLPPALQADPVSLLVYRIQIFNATGHSAGESTVPAYAAAGAAPPQVTSLQARGSEQGAILEWRSQAGQGSVRADAVDFTRTDLLATPGTEKKSGSAAIRAPGKSRSGHPGRSDAEVSNRAHLRASDTPAHPQSETAGTVDTGAAMGGSYSYVAARVRGISIGSRKLEILGEPSVTVTLAMKDTFPPKKPTGLATIPGHAASNPASARPDVQNGRYVDLSWEPNDETDLAGYRVYRQLARPDGLPQGPLARLTALPIAAPAYRDVAVEAGQGYIYSVTAVDAAGNESAPSAKVLEVLFPDTGGSPH